MYINCSNCIHSFNLDTFLCNLISMKVYFINPRRRTFRYMRCLSYIFEHLFCGSMLVVSSIKTNINPIKNKLKCTFYCLFPRSALMLKLTFSIINVSIYFSTGIEKFSNRILYLTFHQICIFVDK